MTKSLLDRGARRRFRLGAQALLGLDRGGFIIPYRYPKAAAQGYPALVPYFAAANPLIVGQLQIIAQFAPALRAIGGPPPEPRFDQDWFPRLDAAALYALVRERQPSRIIEIGSGHSTRFASRAIRDGGLATEITCIDPSPRALIAGLSVRHERKLLHEVAEDLADRLEAGDFLIVDSSHVAMPGTDLDRLLAQVLPSLKRGVFVHFHDIFLPDSYPEAWAWRGYNEQLLLAALIIGQAFAVHFSSHWLRTHVPELLKEHPVMELPMKPGALESSLWLEKTSPPAYCEA